MVRKRVIAREQESKRERERERERGKAKVRVRVRQDRIGGYYITRQGNVHQRALEGLILSPFQCGFGLSGVVYAQVPFISCARGTCIDGYRYRCRCRCRYSYGGKERGRIGSGMVRMRAIAREKDREI